MQLQLLEALTWRTAIGRCINTQLKILQRDRTMAFIISLINGVQMSWYTRYSCTKCFLTNKKNWCISRNILVIRYKYQISVYYSILAEYFHGWVIRTTTSLVLFQFPILELNNSSMGTINNWSYNFTLLNSGTKTEIYQVLELTLELFTLVLIDKNIRVVVPIGPISSF